MECGVLSVWNSIVLSRNFPSSYAGSAIPRKKVPFRDFDTIGIHSIDAQHIGFRERFYHMGLSYSPIMHGSLSLDQGNIVIRGYLNWSLLVVLFVFAKLSHGNPLILGFFAVIFALCYGLQLHQYRKLVGVIESVSVEPTAESGVPGDSFRLFIQQNRRKLGLGMACVAVFLTLVIVIAMYQEKERPYDALIKKGTRLNGRVVSAVLLSSERHITDSQKEFEIKIGYENGQGQAQELTERIVLGDINRTGLINMSVVVYCLEGNQIPCASSLNFNMRNRGN